MAAIGTFARRIPRRSFVALATGDNGTSFNIFRLYYIIYLFSNLIFLLCLTVSKLGANDVALKMSASLINGIQIYKITL